MDTAFSYDCGSRLVHSAHLFTGKERDTESGNDYFGARYYASTMGRFMSPDPSKLSILRTTLRRGIGRAMSTIIPFA